MSKSKFTLIYDANAVQGCWHTAAVQVIALFAKEQVTSCEMGPIPFLTLERTQRAGLLRARAEKFELLKFLPTAKRMLELLLCKRKGSR